MKGSWVYEPKPVKLEKQDKEALLWRVNKVINTSDKLKKAVNRIDVKAGRVYLYHLVEQFGWDDPERIFIEPLIDGKYAEFPYARITIFDSRYGNCSTD